MNTPSTSLLWPLFWLPLIAASPVPTNAVAADISTDRVLISVTPTGEYSVTAKSPEWKFAGKLPSPVTGLKENTGQDAVGFYHQTVFSLANGGLSGFIRLYDGKSVVLFSDSIAQAGTAPPAPFPDFTTLPTGMFSLSYRNSVFASVQFDLKESMSSPWLFFDGQKHAMLISSANHFLISTMTGDGKAEIASGFNDKLANLPAGFTQQTLLAFGDGINATYDLWGQALTDLQGKKRPANDADTLLKYFGYWTDNGADYYYHYDADKGYAGTLKALVDSYRQEQIPLHYLQLDSWWYHKTFTGPTGKEGTIKNSALPAGDWNCYGGLLDYTPSSFLFPKGLKAFQADVGGLSFVTHNRWIDPASPYHQRFKISGIAAVDPKFWDELADFMKANGIETYEQDWLNEIFAHSPELNSTVDGGDAFLDNMARACREKGITVQYCMGLPRCFLQGSKYDNLTTIRCCGDRFDPRNYQKFIFGSRLASALGIWPWADVFKSRETNNLLLANLSAGPVGTGDAIGLEDKANIFKTIRADGVIIKPDRPLVPTDSAYLAEAKNGNGAFLASTYTEHEGLRTTYAAAVMGKKESDPNFALVPSDLGVVGPAYAYDYFAGTATRLEKDQSLPGKVDASRVAYYIVAPVGASGIAFLGDKDKFVSNGTQRIASLKDQPGQLSAEVLLAAGESAVTLHGYADSKPSVEVQSGLADAVQYDATTKHFTVVIHPGANVPADNATPPVRHVTVTFKTN